MTFSQAKHFLLITTALSAAWSPIFADEKPIDFNRDIRAILSNKCFQCHGPDENERQSGLRLDSSEGARGETDSGSVAVVAGKPAESELVRRITSQDAEERMPPAKTGKKLSQREIELLTEWIRQGANYAKHWSYEKPVRPELPPVQNKSWPKNDVDHFILSRLEREGLTPTEAADRYAIIRRVSLDLTGLPPTLAEVQQFVDDADPQAYEKLVDRLLDKEAYGEHWARRWLDLARYADSAGYADDPPRVIWGYRDWVIRAFNQNMPFDQFTIEQLAGDLLPSPTIDQLVATGFHRNTQTNNEGGTNDEEYRNVAVVDRVNTTMAVWMGTTMACAQCHNHKFDPISQKEYFEFFAVFNNTADADVRDESPLVDVWTSEQEQQKVDWSREIVELEKTIVTPTPDLLAAQQKWETQFTSEPKWQTLKPSKVTTKSSGEATITDANAVLVPKPSKTDVYDLEIPVAELARVQSPNSGESGYLVTAVRIESLPHESLPGKGAGHGGGNFVVTRVLASIVPPQGSRLVGRYVQIENTGPAKFLSLAEVQVFSGADNIAPKGEAKQSSTDFNGPAALAIDGNTNGDYQAAKSTTHTASEGNPWWELDLKAEQPIDRLVVWNRTDNGLHTRLADFRATVLNEKREKVWEQAGIKTPPNPSTEFSLSGVRGIELATALPDYSQGGFDAAKVLDDKNANESGWAVGSRITEPHTLTLIPKSPIEIADGAILSLKIEQLSKHENHTLGHFRIAATTDRGVSLFATTPSPILAITQTPADKRTDAQRSELTTYYLSIAPELKGQRDQLANVKKQLADIKPFTNVPIMRERSDKERRVTKIQHRGNFLDTGDEVATGLPTAFHSSTEVGAVNRLTLARWIMDENNPLTARVIANRYWESIFGLGLVQTSEEFGSQGEPPSHPELLDWLATELIRLKWDTKVFVKLLVTSAAYRQSSRVTPELMQRDPANQLLARGPRFRLSAEMVRDQALFVAGLLSDKLYGPPVKPPQPELGVSAAFGGGIDWQTSDGPDRYRRGMYTTWRRSNPYPSMAAFDAPSREVCTIRRDRTNTPLQALVTLNDPVYVEASQALGRRMHAHGQSIADKVTYGFQLCLSRPPSENELRRTVSLYEIVRERFAQDPQNAKKIATLPIGPAPEGASEIDLAAWSVVGNVLLNLDEMFMKR